MPPCSTTHQLSHHGTVTATLQHRDTGEAITRSNTRDDVKKTNNGEFKLLKVQEVPDHHKEISIWGGYRQRLEYKDCFLSIFKIHNETVNIWTHLLGFLIFFSLMLRDALWAQDHIRNVTDLAANLLQLITYQVRRSDVLCHHYHYHYGPPLYRHACYRARSFTRCHVMTPGPRGRGLTTRPS